MMFDTLEIICKAVYFISLKGFIKCLIFFRQNINDKVTKLGAYLTHKHLFILKSKLIALGVPFSQLYLGDRMISVRYYT